MVSIQFHLFITLWIRVSMIFPLFISFVLLLSANLHAIFYTMALVEHLTGILCIDIVNSLFALPFFLAMARMPDDFIHFNLLLNDFPNKESVYKISLFTKSEKRRPEQ